MQPESRQPYEQQWVKRCEDVPQLAYVFRVYADRIVLFKQPFESFMANRLYHSAL
jgi:hypothetical protein